jgi:threonine synthase
VTVAAARKLVAQGVIPRDESLVISITGNGLKTQEALAGVLPPGLTIKPTLKAFDEALAAYEAAMRGA